MPRRVVRLMITTTGLSVLTVTLLVAALRYDGEPSFVAFNATISFESGIWRLRPDDGDLLFLAEGSNPRWSPDGRWIAYDNADIFIMRPDGTDNRNLTESERYDTTPSWSPDGQWIVWIYGGNELYRMRVDGSDVQQVTSTEAFIEFPQFSPDGEWIIFNATFGSDRDIYRVRVDGSELQNLTNASGDDTHATFSPEGEWILFEGFRGQRYNIFKMRPDGSEVITLTNSGENDTYPSWSHDGRWIAFYRSRFNGRGGLFSDLFRIRADGSELEQISHSGSNNVAPVYAPSDKWIMFLALDSQGVEIQRLDVQTQSTQTLAEARTFYYPPTWFTGVGWKPVFPALAGLILMLLGLISARRWRSIQ
jgi:TolB protein